MVMGGLYRGREAGIVADRSTRHMSVNTADETCMVNLLIFIYHHHPIHASSVTLS